MMFVFLLFLIVPHAYGLAYSVQMTDVDLNCVKESAKLSTIPMQILTFNIWNDQLSIPGALDLLLAFNVTKKLSADIQFSTKIERKFGPAWVAVPCLAGIGACDKQSLCNLIQQACKTNSFIRANSKDNTKSCPCDLDTGLYTIEHVPIYIKRKKSAKLIKPITTGQYRFKVKFIEAKGKTVVGCVMGYLTLLKPNKFT